MTGQQLPWSVPVAVTDISDTGMHRDITADAAVRSALAKSADLLEVKSAKASFDLSQAAGEQILVRGRVVAKIVQACVVTLEPLETTIDEPIDATFAPAAMIGAMPNTKTHAEDDAPEIDPPEPIVNGAIDLGKLAADFLYLGVDPYPRKPGVVFDVPQSAPDPEDHPFAALKALKGHAKGPKGEES